MVFFENKNDFKSLKYWIPILVVGSILMVFGLNEITDNVFEEYPLLKSNEYLNGVVLDYRDYKSTTLIVLKDRTFKSIMAYNWTMEKNALYQHLQEGDSISCKPNSKKLTLFKKNSGNVIDIEVQYLE